MCAVCQGTTYGVVPLFLEEFPYQQLKDRYTNCTYLVGNLELVFPDAPGKNIDLSFLSTIKQVRTWPFQTTWMFSVFSSR